MKKRKLSVTIGIPAHNEEANIGRLLLSLLSQKGETFSLKRILVISDGSRDKTIKEVQKVISSIPIKSGSKITIISFTHRRGLNEAQNEIIKRSKTDVLLILNGDVIPKDMYFINEIVAPIRGDKRIGIVSASLVSVAQRNFVGRVLAHSFNIKSAVYRKLNNSNNVYLCFGQARAFSKAFYSQLRWPDNCPEDAFSYFTCVKKGFDFFFTPKTSVTFSMSTTIQDHIKQSNRFLYGQKKLEEFFPKDFVRKSYHIPLHLLAKTILKFAITDPALTFGYLSLILFVRTFKRYVPAHHSKYEISHSSKKLHTWITG